MGEAKTIKEGVNYLRLEPVAKLPASEKSKILRRVATLPTSQPLVVCLKNSWSNFERESCVESIDRRLRKLLRINLIRIKLRSSIIRALTSKLSQEFLRQTTSGLARRRGCDRHSKGRFC